MKKYIILLFILFINISLFSQIASFKERDGFEAKVYVENYAEYYKNGAIHTYRPNSGFRVRLQLITDFTAEFWNDMHVGWGISLSTRTYSEYLQGNYYFYPSTNEQNTLWVDKEFIGKKTEWIKVTIRRDDSAPSINPEDLNEDWSGGNYSITASSSDSTSGIRSFQYRFDSGTLSNVPTNGIITYTGEGVHSIYLKAIDKVGNSATRTGTFSIDKSAPVAEIITPADWQRGSGGMIQAAGTDIYSGINPDTWRYRVNDGSWSGQSAANSSYTTTMEGVTKVNFQFQDNVGNWSPEVTGNIYYPPPKQNGRSCRQG